MNRNNHHIRQFFFYLIIFFLVLLRYNWQKRKIFNMYIVVIWIYMENYSSHWVNYTSIIISHIYPFLSQWECLHSTLLANFSYTLPCYQPQSACLHYILRPYHLIIESLYSFTNLTLFPLHPSPWQSLFYSVSMILTFFSFTLHVSDTMQYLYSSVWLISFSIMPSQPMHVVAKGRISFFFMAEQ